MGVAVLLLGGMEVLLIALIPYYIDPDVDIIGRRYISFVTIDDFILTLYFFMCL